MSFLTAVGDVDVPLSPIVSFQDKTFGLKNKKGAKTQKYIQHIQKNTLGNLQKKNDQPNKKEEKKKELAELNTIFRPVQPIQKVEAGVNPKSVLCAFFKQGTCTKGDKCKFSHDMSLERKSATRNYYETEKEDKMENWDDEKLKEVVEKKHAEADKKNVNKTDIICKYFLDALENSKYGWFWECPNGGEKCIYKHVLPVGYTLKRDLKKEKKEEISIEDLVERERAALGYDLPKINLASFTAWKKRKIEEKKAKAQEEADKRKADFKAGKSVALSGREMFTFNPDLIAEEGEIEEGDAAFDMSTREDLNADEGEVRVVDLDLEKLAAEARDVDGSGTVAEKERKFEVTQEREEKSQEGADPEGATGPINEDLFDDDDDGECDDDDEEEELDDLEKGLNDVHINSS